MTSGLENKNQAGMAPFKKNWPSGLSDHVKGTQVTSHPTQAYIPSDRKRKKEKDRTEQRIAAQKSTKNCEQINS